MACFFGLVANSLRGFRRSAVADETAGDGRRRCLEKVERDLLPLQLTASLCRAIMHLALVAGLMYLYGGPDHAKTWGGALVRHRDSGGFDRDFRRGEFPGVRRAAAGDVGRRGDLRRDDGPAIRPVARRGRDAGVRDPGAAAGGPARRRGTGPGPAGDPPGRHRGVRPEGKVEHEEVQMIASVIGFADRRAVR